MPTRSRWTHSPHLRHVISLTQDHMIFIRQFHMTIWWNWKYLDAIICTFIYAYDILSLLEVLRHWKGDLVLWFCLAEISCAFTHLPWTKWLPFYTQYFQIHFRNEKFRILIRILLKFVPTGPVDTNPALVLIMAWHQKATSHYLNQCWPDSQKIHAALGGDEFSECLYCG